MVDDDDVYEYKPELDNINNNSYVNQNKNIDANYNKEGNENINLTDVDITNNFNQNLINDSTNNQVTNNHLNNNQQNKIHEEYNVIDDEDNITSQITENASYKENQPPSNTNPNPNNSNSPSTPTILTKPTPHIN